LNDSDFPSDEVTKRSYPAVRTAFIRSAGAHLDALANVDALVEEVRHIVTTYPPPRLVGELQQEALELDLDLDEKASTKPPSSV
jgi:hypothetical protein